MGSIQSPGKKLFSTMSTAQNCHKIPMPGISRHPLLVVIYLPPCSELRTMRMKIFRETSVNPMLSDGKKLKCQLKINQGVQPESQSTTELHGGKTWVTCPQKNRKRTKK